MKQTDLEETGMNDAEQWERRKIIRLSNVMVIECDYLKEVLFSQKDKKKYSEKSLKELVDSLQKHASEIGEVMHDGARDPMIMSS